MKLFGGFNGKRVKKTKFQLYRQKDGKRLAQKPNDFFYQTIQLISGKIKYLSNRLKEFMEYVAFDEMDFEYDDLSNQEKSIDSKKEGNLTIVNVTIQSLLDVEKIVSYVENGYAVIASYEILTESARSEFDKRLSIKLMQLGTHLTHISQSEIICAGREISVEDNISKKSHKIGECINFDEREEEDFEEVPVTREPTILEEYFASLDNKNGSILNITVHSLEDVEKVISYVEEGYIMVVNYGRFTAVARRNFDKKLSIELMQLGTHLTHISQSEIICAKREISIEDNISKKGLGKVYELNAIKR